MMHKWVDFKDILPNENATFLTVDTEGNYYIRTLKRLYKLINVPGIYIKERTPHGAKQAEVTHWMVLPQPPGVK